MKEAEKLIYILRVSKKAAVLTVNCGFFDKESFQMYGKSEDAAESA